MAVAQLGQQRDHHLGHALEGARVEDLGADVGLDPQPPDARLPGEEPERGVELAAAQVEPELGIFLARADELVRVGLDAGGDAQEDVHGVAVDVREGEQQPQLVEVVHVDAADADGEGAKQLLGRFVVALQHAGRGGHASLQGRVQLAGRDDIEAQPFLVHERMDGHHGEGLAGVEHPAAGRVVGPERLDVGPARDANGLLVEHEQGRTVDADEVARRAAADDELAQPVAGARHRPDHLVGRGAGPGHGLWREAALPGLAPGGDGVKTRSRQRCLDARREMASPGSLVIIA